MTSRSARKRNLMLIGGPAHPFAETAPMVERLLTEAGFETHTTEDVEGGLAQLAAEAFDLITVHCLRWSMTQDPKYEPLRAQYALSLSQPARAAIVSHMARGGGLLGLHTASIAFDDWPEWAGILGAGWRWGRSHHPPYGRLDVRIRDARHPVTAGIADFTCDDELYSALDLAPDAHVLAEARIAGIDGAQPIALAREPHGAGRAVYLGLGHDGASLATPAYAQMVTQAAVWASEAQGALRSEVRHATA